MSATRPWVGLSSAQSLNWPCWQVSENEASSSVLRSSMLIVPISWSSVKRSPRFAVPVMFTDSTVRCVREKSVSGLATLRLIRFRLRQLFA